jgi:hypothetical protein
MIKGSLRLWFGTIVLLVCAIPLNGWTETTFWGEKSWRDPFWGAVLIDLGRPWYSDQGVYQINLPQRYNDQIEVVKIRGSEIVRLCEHQDGQGDCRLLVHPRNKDQEGKEDQMLIYGNVDENDSSRLFFELADTNLKGKVSSVMIFKDEQSFGDWANEQAKPQIKKKKLRR